MVWRANLQSERRPIKRLSATASLLLDQHFFNRDMGGYILGPYIQEYYQGSADAFHKQAADIDDRLMMVMNLRRGTLLKYFPLPLTARRCGMHPLMH